MLNFQVDVSVKHHLKQSIIVNAQFSATIMMFHLLGVSNTDLFDTEGIFM